MAMMKISKYFISSFPKFQINQLLFSCVRLEFNFLFLLDVSRDVEFSREQREVPTALGGSSVKLINPNHRAPVVRSTYPHPRDHPGQIH